MDTDELEMDEAERAYELGRKAGGGAPVKNPFGRGGRAGHYARKHLADAIRVTAEILHSDRATDEAKIRAADLIVRTAKG